MLPGTTHIQPAQPVLFAHHLLAYVEMAERDRGRLADARARLNVSPLGSGALAGAGYPLDREATATELGFDGVSANSLDAVSDRDFVVETISAVALGMVHLSRLAEEITWWSNPRFGFVRVADAFSTGSSMMPNKKNPDPAELVRGRAARVIGELTGALTLLKGLPLAYQRDLQESVAPLFDAVEVFETSLRVMAGLVETLTVDAERMRAAAGEGYTTATAVADTLVRRGVAFRAAHHIVGALVAGRRPTGSGWTRSRIRRSPRRWRRATMRRRRRWPTNPGSPMSYGRPPRSTAHLPRATSSAGPRRRGSPRPSPRPGSASTGPDRATSGGNGRYAVHGHQESGCRPEGPKSSIRPYISVVEQSATSRTRCGSRAQAVAMITWNWASERPCSVSRVGSHISGSCEANSKDCAPPPNWPSPASCPTQTVIVSSRPPLTVTSALTRSSRRTSWTLRGSPISRSSRPRNGEPTHNGDGSSQIEPRIPSASPSAAG